MTIKKYIPQVNTKTLNEKNLCLFNKKTPLHAGLGSKQQNFLATAKQLIRKNSICSLKNQAFHRANIKIDLTTPSLCSFSFGF